MNVEPILPPERVAAMRRAGLWPGLTLQDCLQRAVRERPSETAVIDHNSVTGRRTQLCYRELNARSLRIASGLWHAGVRAGDVVSIQLPNWWQFMALHLACVRIGAITNPLMPIFRERELSFMLDLAKSKVLVVPQRFRNFDHSELAAALRLKLPALKEIFVVGGDVADSFEHRLLGGPGSLPVEAAQIGPDDVVQILYTSGTTGEPKGVMHTSNTLFSNLESYVRRVGLRENDVVLMVSPLAHQTGFMFGMMMPIQLGCTAVLQDVWEPEKGADIVQREKATYTFSSTPFLADMTEVARRRPEAFDSLRLFHAAGATIPRALVREATEGLGATILSGWGMTENGAATCTRPGDPPEKIFETDGCAQKGMELRIVDEDARVLPTGASGHLQVRGCSNFVGYLHRPELYETDAEGWFASGDIARLDADGYLRITGRSKDVVIRGGENVPVVEIEGLLFKHPAVREVSIVGRTDPRLGERCAAWVVPWPDQHPPTLPELIAYLQECGVARNYFPEFLRLVPDLPRTPSGKVQKFKLRAQEAERRD